MIVQRYSIQWAALYHAGWVESRVYENGNVFMHKGEL